MTCNFFTLISDKYLTVQTFQTNKNLPKLNTI